MRIATAPANQPEAGPPSARTATAHELDPMLARALYAVWSGEPAVVVDSPPGAGKTRLVTHLATQLATRAGRTVAIAAQTRAQGVDVANRIAALGGPVTMLGNKDRERPRGLAPAVRVVTKGRIEPDHGIVVATTARWLITLERFDVLLIDEAYQLTFANFGGLAVLAPQVVMVGDPGQIAPVVTANPRRWAHSRTGPHLPAPAALTGAYPDSLTRLRLPHTWRLGPATTELIRPLYDIPFTSRRPPTHAHLNGRKLPEYVAVPVPAATPADTALVLAAADRARELLTATITDDGQTRAASATDLAVIAPHVDQATMLAAALADVSGVFVGTTNQAQGLERALVVAIHPLAGYASVPEFAADPGRLCVALSRHRTHLTVITDPRTPSILSSAAASEPRQELLIQGAILAALTTANL